MAILLLLLWALPGFPAVAEDDSTAAVEVALAKTSDKSKALADTTASQPEKEPEEMPEKSKKEWRILQSVPPAQAEEGFEGATWGEARRRAWERNFCRSPS